MKIIMKQFMKTTKTNDTNIETNTTYKTKDFYLAVTLKTLGFSIVGANKQGSVITFEFTNKEECEKEVINYFNRKIVLNVHDFVTNIKQFQHIIHGDYQL